MNDRSLMNFMPNFFFAAALSMMEPASFAKTRRVRSFLVAIILLVLLAIAGAQAEPTEAADQNPGSDEQFSTPSPSEAALKESIQLAIESLGSSEFAVREHAAEQLMAIGIKAMPSLRDLSNHQDPEVRMRASDLIRQLTAGDFQKRVDAFLAGKDIHFDGWEYVQDKLGSSPGIRELFIELTKGYPTLVEALEGTSRDRALTLDSTVQRIQNAIIVERRWPEPVDAIAILLPVSDPNVPISSSLENILLGILRREAGTKIRLEQQLAAPVTALIGDWVERSTIHNRGEVLFFSLEWGIPEAYSLAIRTLGETREIDALVKAMQAIARYGNADDVKLVAKLLDDHRSADERGYVIGSQTQTTMGDVAMATIAIIHHVPLSELGWELASVDSRYSFRVDEIGFPVDEPELRAKARAKVDELVAKPVPKS